MSNGHLRGAPPADLSLSVDGQKLPAILQDQLSELEAWATRNRDDARRDAIRFWMLKIPAVLVSASGSIFAYYKLSTVSIISGAIVSFCVLIDGLNPGGVLRNIHYRAFHDLRKVQMDMQARWRIDSWNANTEDAKKQIAASILKDHQEEITRIAHYIRDAETALRATETK